ELKQVLILEDDFVVLRINRHGAVSRIWIANDSYGWPVQGDRTAPIRNGSGRRLGGEPLLPQGGRQTNRTGRGNPRTQFTSHCHFRQRLHGNQLRITCGSASSIDRFAAQVVSQTAACE